MNANLRAIRWAAAVLSVSLGVTSCYGPTPGRPAHGSKLRDRFETWDTDHDGRLGYQEFSHSRLAQRAYDPKQLFARIDADGDRFLTPAEFREYHRKQKAGRAS